MAVAHFKWNDPINKKAIKVMNWQRLRHAVVSAMLLTITLLILSMEEKL